MEVQLPVEHALYMVIQSMQLDANYQNNVQGTVFRVDALLRQILAGHQMTMSLFLNQPSLEYNGNQNDGYQNDDEKHDHGHEHSGHDGTEIDGVSGTIPDSTITDSASAAAAAAAKPIVTANVCAMLHPSELNKTKTEMDVKNGNTDVKAIQAAAATASASAASVVEATNANANANANANPSSIHVSLVLPGDAKHASASASISTSTSTQIANSEKAVAATAPKPLNKSPPIYTWWAETWCPKACYSAHGSSVPCMAWKVSYCLDAETGKCKKAETCKYAHSEKELRTVCGICSYCHSISSECPSGHWKHRCVRCNKTHRTDSCPQCRFCNGLHASAECRQRKCPECAAPIKTFVDPNTGETRLDFAKKWHHTMLTCPMRLCMHCGLRGHLYTETKACPNRIGRNRDRSRSAIGLANFEPRTNITLPLCGNCHEIHYSFDCPKVTTCHVCVSTTEADKDNGESQHTLWACPALIQSKAYGLFWKG